MLTADERELKIDKGGRGLKVWGTSPTGRPHVCFLIHGYNVTPEEAQAAFDQLLAAMHFAGRVPPVLERESWRVYWEGYQRSVRNVLTKSRFGWLTYFYQVRIAKKSATCLAKYIAGLRGPGGTPVEISFIAHSLGCRLVLEALRELRDQPGPRVRVMAFMAAAVPAHMVYPGRALRSAAEAPERTWVLYSSTDYVLEAGFRLGQFFAGERGMPATAVGHAGEPESGLWTTRVATVNSHGGYFGDFDTARALAEAFDPGWVPPSPKVLPARPQPQREMDRSQLPIKHLAARTQPAQMRR